MTIQPRVVDISHHNKVTDLKATAMSGVWGVIHKSSQGSGYRDPDYAPRRQQARAAGLLWGAYHFNDGSDVAGQVDWFLKCAAPDESTLLVLDFEDNPKSNMTVQQAVQFLKLLEQKTGRKAAIYSGNRLKETIGHLSSADHAYVCSHRLWLCQYGPRPVMPMGFSHYWLWQYTGDGVGQGPHNVPGIVAGNRGLDLNVYDGDRAKLTSEWAPRGLAPVVEPIAAQPDEEQSSHARQAEADQDSRSYPTAPAAPPVAPVAIDTEVVGDPDLYSAQKRLKGRNYSPGILDGKWGGGVSGALSGFRNDREMRFAMPTSLEEFHDVKDEVAAELTKAENEVQPDGSVGWFRPVSAARKAGDAATVAAVAPEVVPVKQNRLLTIWGAIGATFTGIYKTFSDTISNAWDTLFGFFTDHKDDIPTDPGVLQTVWGYVTSIPTAVWIFAGAAGFVILALKAHGAVKKITESVQTGARQ